VSSILDGSYKRKPDRKCARGVVSHVLNENFGLVSILRISFSAEKFSEKFSSPN
jgi:hypothetical protein